MSESNNRDDVTHLHRISEALEGGIAQQVKLLLRGLSPAEIANLLESLPQSKRNAIWDLVQAVDEGDVLLHLNDEIRATLIKDMDTDEVVAAASGMDVDDLADFMQDLPRTLIDAILDSLDRQNRQELVAVMSYPEDTAGGLMDMGYITIRPDVTLDVILRYLRLRGDMPDHTDALFVVDRHSRYIGSVKINMLITSAPTLTAIELLDDTISPINVTTDERDVAQLFRDRDLISAPVIDESGKLVGRITIDDIVDVMQNAADHSVMSMAGLEDDEAVFAPILPSARRRAIWLGVNLITAIAVSVAIGLFQDTIDQIVALAVLMPIVANMGGVAGSQTLTLVIRGIALGQVGPANAFSLARKEIAVNLLNAAVWSCAVGMVAYAWYDDAALGMIIGTAMIINLFCGALAGVYIPLILRRMQIDPAIAGGVILTTVTDIVGFVSFLALAAVILL